MSELLIHRDEWVVVCDGAKALVLENTGDAKFPNLKTVEVYRAEGPGRPTSSAPIRPAAPLVRPATAAELRRRRPTGTTRPSRPSSRNLAKHLDAAIAAGKTKSLIMVAPPRALGMIRPAYSHALRAARARRGRQGSGQAAGARDREAPDRRLSRPEAFLDYGWPAAIAMLWSPRDSSIKGRRNELNLRSMRARRHRRVGRCLAGGGDRRGRCAAAQSAAGRAPPRRRSSRRPIRWRCPASGIRAGGRSGRTCRASASSASSPRPTIRRSTMPGRTARPPASTSIWRG